MYVCNDVRTELYCKLNLIKSESETEGRKSENYISFNYLFSFFSKLSKAS
jgi:hypothetical protein